MLNVPSDFALRRSRSVLMFAIIDDYGLGMPSCAKYVQKIKQKRPHITVKSFDSCGPTWARTRDHLIMSQVL